MKIHYLKKIISDMLTKQGSVQVLKRTSQILFQIFILLQIIPGAYAQTIPLFASLDITEIYSNPGKTQQLKLFNNLGNTYVADNNWQNKLTAILGIGATAYQSPKFLVNTSLRYIPITSIPVTGEIWQLNSPLFANIEYKYRVSSNVLLFEGAISSLKFLLRPSLSFGIGPTINRATSYSELPRNTKTMLTTQKFSGASSTSFAYAVGAGLDYPYKNLIIELAYRYINAGQATLGPMPTQSINKLLSSGQLQYHSISLGVRLYYDYML